MSTNVQIRLPTLIADRLQEMCSSSGFSKSVVIGNLVNAAYERSSQKPSAKPQLPAYIRELKDMKPSARDRHMVLAVAKRHNIVDRYWDLLTEVGSKMPVSYNSDTEDPDLREDEFRGFEHVWAARPAWVLRREAAQQAWRDRQVSIAQSRYGAPDPITPSNPNTQTPEEREAVARKLHEMAGLTYNSKDTSDEQSDD